MRITSGPAALKGPYDSSGFPVGCKSSCNANLDGNQANSPNCCTGQHSTPETCPASGVAFYNYFSMQNSLAVFFLNRVFDCLTCRIELSQGNGVCL